MFWGLSRRTAEKRQGVRRSVRSFEPLEPRWYLSTGPLLDRLTLDAVNQLEDNNFESMIYDADGDGIVDVGDRFAGVYKVQGYDADVPNPPGVQNLGGTERTITALFLLEALKKDTPGANDPVEIFFGPLQDDGDADGTGSGNDAIDEWNDVLTGLGVDTTGIIPTQNGTMAILFDHSSLDGADQATGALATSIDAYTGNGAGISANKLYEVGFTANDANNDGFGDTGTEFWITAGPIGTDDTSLVAITSANNFIGVNVLAEFPGSVPLLPHTHLVVRDATNSTAFAVGHDWQGEGGFLYGTSPGDFAIATDTDLFIKPTEEEGDGHGRVVPTGTTCQQYVDHVINGNPDDPSDDGDFADGGFNYSVKYDKHDNRDEIFNVSDPGAAFYYTTFEAPSDSFTVAVDQDAVGLGEEYEMDLTALQVGEVVGTAPNATCNTLIGNINIADSPDPSVALNLPGAAGTQLVLRWRINPSSIEGEADPGVTYTLNFSTLVNGSEVDSDPDGVLVIGPADGLTAAQVLAADYLLGSGETDKRDATQAEDLALLLLQ